VASLHKDPHGRSPFWYGAFIDQHGQRRLRSTKTSNKKEARIVLNTWVKAANIGNRLTLEKAREVISAGVAEILAVSNQELPSATAKEWFERWLGFKELETKQRTHERYVTCLNRFEKFLKEKAGKDLNLIRADDIQRYRDLIAKKLSATSVNMDLKTIRSALAAARKADLVDANVAMKVDLLKVRDKQRRRAFTDDEIAKIFKVCDQAGPEWRGLCLAGLYTGQRLADVATIQWGQINLKKGSITFTTGKTGNRVGMKLAGPLADYLKKEAKKKPETDEVFPEAAEIARRHSGTLSNRFYDRILVPAGLVAERPKNHGTIKSKGRSAKREVSEISFHSFRHKLTTWLKAAGASNAMAQMIVGHESPAVSANYTHLNEDDTSSYMQKLPDVTTPKKKAAKKRK